MRPAGERALIRRTARRLAVQTGAAVSGALLLVGAAAWVVAGHEQTEAADRQLTAAVRRMDDVTDPPDRVYLFVRSAGGVLRATPGSPPGLPDVAALSATSGDGRLRDATVQLGGGLYRVRTQLRAGQVVQAALDLTGLREERGRLLVALALAEGFGVGAAVLVGAVLGRRAVTPLADALARQRRFVTDAAHELRTPLTLLHTRVQLLEREARQRGDPLLSGEAAELVTDTRRLGDVVEDLLQSADLANDPSQYTDVDLDQLAAEAVAAAAAHARQLGVGLTLRPAGTGQRAAAERPAVVPGVESALRRAVAALLDNALGHTPAGGSVTVAVTGADPRNGMAGVSVTDTGVGLDAADSERLFERFARDQRAGDRRRFGLGLALVQETVANHGGRVEVGGVPGGGASFTLLVPAQRPPARRR